MAGSLNKSMQAPYLISDEAAMLALGAELASLLQPGMIFYFRGELGAGKTTLVRGLIRHLGHSGSIKSPTYTLVEPYSFEKFEFYHFDLYRIKEPAELFNIGFKDYLRSDSVCVIEWPEQALALLPPPTLDCEIQVLDSGRSLVLKTEHPDIQLFLRSRNDET